ncbi:hypothetical protein [Brevundimonas diminuta]|uniref:hypothetical protein n=1 Tax=Brevundimonas diminuta TaxID=293 RepID=UPI003208D3A3
MNSRLAGIKDALIVGCLCLLCASIGITAVTKAANAVSMERTATALEKLAEDNRLQRIALEQLKDTTHDR